mmetsp:Transcript_25843/g.41007  ORF Transcript_25843/g.41007 Transcript_25843/m.41007 type:complete len:214 (-) Transcript_25843:65-706(-)
MQRKYFRYNHPCYRSPSDTKTATKQALKNNAQRLILNPKRQRESEQSGSHNSGTRQQQRSSSNLIQIKRTNKYKRHFRQTHKCGIQQNQVFLHSRFGKNMRRIIDCSFVSRRLLKERDSNTNEQSTFNVLVLRPQHFHPSTTPLISVMHNHHIIVIGHFDNLCVSHRYDRISATLFQLDGLLDLHHLVEDAVLVASIYAVQHSVRFVFFAALN